LTLGARASPLARQVDAGWADPWAERLLAQCPWDLRRAGQDAALVRAVVVRSRIFDDAVRDACASGDVFAVVSIGIGLCTRQGRVAPECSGPQGHGPAWVDVDLPDVIALRRLLLPQALAAAPASLLVACGLQDPAWLDAVPWRRGYRCLVLVEGVAPYVPATAMTGMLHALAVRARQEGCGCQVVIDYLHRDFVPIAALQAGPAVLPVTTGFQRAEALAPEDSGFRTVRLWEPFGEFSEAHRALQDDFRARHGHAPYAVARFDLQQP
jgi:O-methyltransferase involved in polyketide biosynthesis